MTILTVNQVSQLDNYPIPKIDILLAEISSRQKFAKLDLKHAYQQMFLAESSCELLTINTHLGLLKPTRLIFDVRSATRIFQRTTEKKLKGLKNKVKVDNIYLLGEGMMLSH